MGLNDEQEKLRQAEQWLWDCEIGSHQFDAAWEHVVHVSCTSQDIDLRNQALRIRTQYEGGY